MTTETFQRGRITLVWSEGHELHGLRVNCRRRPLEEVLDGWLRESDDGRPWSTLSVAEKVEQAKANAAVLAALIMSWNLADDNGVPVPWPPLDQYGQTHPWPPPLGPAGDEARAAGGALLMQHCDDDMISDMRQAYLDATLRVAPPLPQKSESGPDGPSAPSETSTAPEDWTPVTLPAAQEVSPPS